MDRNSVMGAGRAESYGHFGMKHSDLPSLDQRGDCDKQQHLEGLRILKDPISHNLAHKSYFQVLYMIYERLAVCTISKLH